MRPVICMITDGSLGMGQSVEMLLARVTVAATAGVHLIQVREHALDDRTLLHVVQQCLDVVRGTRARVIVNDRLDVALASSAHGVHLKSGSVPPKRARTITPAGFLIGQSVHSAAEAAAAGQSADYVIFGTVFESSSKPGRTPAGSAALGDAVRATAVPVLAVGGVTADNAADVARGGAAGVAAIGLFASDRAGTVSAVDRIIRAFDLPMTGS